VRKRNLVRRIPVLGGVATTLDHYELELAKMTEVNTALGSGMDALAHEQDSLRSQVEALAADNDRLRRYLNGLAFSPDATEGADDGWPLPSASLRFLVAGTDDLEVFLQLGRNGAELVRQMPGRHGRKLTEVGRVLDFGCGCGRVARHLAAAGAEIYGCDASPLAIRWCETHLSFGRYAVTALTPPLPYPDAHFGLVYAFSVFTHLPVDLQRVWMDEMHRVVAPGGFLLFSAHGDACTEVLTLDERGDYDAGKAVVRLGERAGANECAAFHPPAYVRSVLTAGWDVVEHAPSGATGNPPQDAYLLRRVR
jgi:SAM-dependent methyltransferase